MSAFTSLAARTAAQDVLFRVNMSLRDEIQRAECDETKQSLLRMAALTAELYDETKKARYP